MSLIRAIFFSALCVIAVSCNGVQQILEDAEIVPDVIDRAPSQALDVTYPGGEIVNLGNELRPSQVQSQPSVVWNPQPDVLYTLSVVDPDAPSREQPTLREVNHWLVTNILGSDLSSGDVVVEYIGSGPPEGSGLHRYVFLLFIQEGEIEVEEQLDSRYNFSIRDFAEKYNLGDPVEANFFEAQWEG